ncbi:hypothetical protein FRC08_008596 [Ceratobasidium sp. 394]|nr:hypothetical protein FRC08_008596 [Ceratobasidium sp. 394]KAG9078096.1 hypothetical protein FS749_009945 [Ceratobasidium sp. UAMH 11750]
MPPLSAFTRYTSSFIGATLLTSIAFRSLLHRRTSTAERDRLTAHTTILESLVARLRAGEDVGEAEIGRLLRLARSVEEGEGEVRDTPWREVLFGRRVREDESLEVARREWDAAVVQDLSNSSMKPVVQAAVQPASPVLTAPNAQPTSSKRPTYL